MREGETLNRWAYSHARIPDRHLRLIVSVCLTVAYYCWLGL